MSVNATTLTLLDLQAQLLEITASADILWLLWNAYLVLFMQTGFALLEAGLMRAKNTQSILFKNFTDAAIGCIVYYLVGFGFFQSGNPFIGTTGSNFVVNDPTKFGTWIFGWSFCITSTTIVSGAIASRMTFGVYAILTVVMTGFTYPVVSHWVWSDGWLGKTQPGFPNPNGLAMLDFAGCGVVHMVGGCSALTAAYIIGPRKGRFLMDKNGKFPNFEGHSVVLSALGTLILWLGWYGFNPGSTGGISNGLIYVAARAAVNTSIAVCTGGMTTVALTVILDRKHNLWAFLNGLLAGLVAITAPCATIDPWAAFVTGIIAAIVVRYSSQLVFYLRIDDAVDAFAVHGCCGMWGLIATGLFSVQSHIDDAHGVGIVNYQVGRQLGIQLLGGLVIAVWSSAITAVELIILQRLLGTLRVKPEEEDMGIDYVQFGSYAYPDFNSKVKTAQEQYETEVQRAAAKSVKKEKIPMEKTNRKGTDKVDRGLERATEESGSRSSVTTGNNQNSPMKEPLSPSLQGPALSDGSPSNDTRSIVEEDESEYEKNIKAAKEDRIKKAVIGRSSIIDITSIPLDESKK